jgi:glycosyltransferase involved in cell wall biosynthesis
MKNKYEVLRVIPSMNPDNGGVVTAIKESIVASENNNINISILCFDSYDDSWIVGFNNIICLNQNITSYGVNFYYLKWLKENINKFDFVIFDGVWDFHLVGGLLLKKLGKPYAVFTHGMLDPYFNINIIKYLKKIPFWFLYLRKVMKEADAVFFTCHEEERLSRKSFPYFYCTPKIVKLGIAEPLKRNESVSSFLELYPYYKEKKFILYLSRLHPKKGLEDLFQAIKLLPRSFEYKIVIAGSGDLDYVQSLKALCVTLDIKDKIDFIGPIYDYAKWGAFYTAEMFILPTHQENFGLVIAESLACKTPVIITNKANIFEHVQAYGCGLISDDNPNSIYMALVEWLNMSRVQLDGMRENARHCYDLEFSNIAVGNSLELVITDLIGNNKL